MKLFMLALPLALIAAEPKKPKELDDKQKATAAVALAKMQSAIREFSEVNARRELALKAAQEAAARYSAIETEMRKATGAPAGCRLDDDLAWIRDIPGPSGNQQVPCEIEPPKPETKK